MRFLGLVILTLLFVGCKKASERSCVKSVGDEVVIERELGEFNRLYLGPHLKFVLVQDTVNRAIITGGENLLNFVSTELVDGKLFIANENKCNFLRSYKKKVSVELHVKKLQNIEYDATEPVHCQNQLITDFLTVTINESAGRFYMDVNASVLHTVVNRNWGNFEFTGAVNFFKANIRGNSFGNAFGLNVSDSIHVISYSGDDLDINADGVLLRSQIHSSGNIGYIGTPLLIDHTSFGDGQLLDKN